jgi:GNAT superfamily N-acetyltransferase
VSGSSPTSEWPGCAPRSTTDENRARGIGQALHDAAVVALRDAGHARTELWVIAANERARAFYERNGWKLDPSRELVEPVREVRYMLAL